MRVIPALLLLFLLLVTIVPVSAVSPTAVKTLGPVQIVTPRHILYPTTTTTVKTTETVGLEEQIGTLIIESDPPGAEITMFVGGSQIFYTQTLITPLSKPALGLGTTYPYTVYLKMAGYKVYAEQVALQPQQTSTIHAVLIPLTPTPTQPQSAPPAQAGIMTAPVPDTTAQPSVSASPSTSSGGQGATTAPGTGTLSVTTNPAGARIFVDSIPAGASPATIPGLSAGVHNLTMTMPGYAELITQVNIVDGQIMDSSTTLIPATEPTKAKSPGFELIIAGLAVACIILLKRSG